MYDWILLILVAGIVYFGVRIIIKIREISSHRADEEEKRAIERKARLPKDLQDVKIDEPNIEKWDSSRPTEKKTGGDGASEEKPQ